jgi:hypothetical protein
MTKGVDSSELSDADMLDAEVSVSTDIRNILSLY